VRASTSRPTVPSNTSCFFSCSQHMACDHTINFSYLQGIVMVVEPRPCH
jgi:hypothetical protein